MICLSAGTVKCKSRHEPSVNSTVKTLSLGALYSSTAQSHSVDYTASRRSPLSMIVSNNLTINSAFVPWINSTRTSPRRQQVLGTSKVMVDKAESH